MRNVIGILLIVMFAISITGCGERQNNVALGTLERDRIAHTATANEVIVSLPIKQGDFVEKGTVLVELDKTHQKALVAKAKAEHLKAEAYLEKLRNGARVEEVAAATAKVEGAKAALIDSEANYKRRKNLEKEDLASEASLTRALATRDENRAKLSAYQEELKKLTNGTRIEDLQMAEAELAAAVASLASERKKLQDLTITATRSGVLDNLPWNLGERVTVGSPLAIVLAGDAPFARVYIPERYRVNIKQGIELPIMVDGVSVPITGVVRWISNEPAFSPYYALNQDERARLMYLAEVKLPNDKSDLPSGVPAQADLSQFAKD